MKILHLGVVILINFDFYFWLRITSRILLKPIDDNSGFNLNRRCLRIYSRLITRLLL